MNDVAHGVATRSRRLRVALIVFAIVVGGLMVGALVTNRNFWFDEAMIYRAITMQDFAPPGQPLLNYEQTIPYGTYVLQWLLIRSVGLNENLLRIPQLLAYLIGLVAIFRAGRTIRTTTARLASLAAGGLGFAVVTQAAEFKHYIFEYAAAAIILALGATVIVRQYRARSIYTLTTASVIALPFSNTAVFMTTAVVATTLIIGFAGHREALQKARRTFIVCAVGYVVVFAAYYLAFIRPAAIYQLALPFYADANLGTLLIGVLKIYSPTNKPLYLAFGAAIFIVIAAGLALTVQSRGLRHVDDHWYPYLVLVLSITVMAVASIAGLAPFSQPRHVLFLAPAIGLAFGTSVDDLSAQLTDRLHASRSLAIAVGAVCVAVGIGFTSLAGISALSKHEEVGQVLAAADSECSNTYVVYSYQPAAQIYLERDGENIQLQGLVSSASGLGDDSWLQRVRSDFPAYEAAAVQYFKSAGSGCLLSGPTPAIAQLIKPLAAAGVNCELLVTRIGSGMYRCST